MESAHKAKRGPVVWAAFIVIALSAPIGAFLTAIGASARPIGIALLGVFVLSFVGLNVVSVITSSRKARQVRATAGRRRSGS